MTVGPRQARVGSRGMAAIVAFALNIALVYFLMLWLGVIVVPGGPAREPMIARLVDEPRGWYRESDLPAISPHLIKPTLRRLPDAPPTIRIEAPLEAPPLPEPSEMPAASPSGHKDVPGEGSPGGITDEPGEGAGTAILHQVPPIYSQASAQAHEHGVVALRVLVDQQGRPTRIRLQQSSGFPRLDASATDAVRQYRFTPTIKRASAVPTWTTVRLEFDLLPMPVPTAIIGFDTTIAEQIAAAKRRGSGLPRDLPKADEMVGRFASNLFDTLARGPTGEPDAKRGHAPPTPIQVLAKRGRLQSVEFVGLASRGFDCGTATLRGTFTSGRCAIYELRQVGGTSYLLAGMEESASVLKSVAIVAATEPPQGRAAR